jgi:RNA recognition motif-containing protein
VRKANVLLNDQGKSKGAGFVQFGSFEDAQKAVAHCQSSGLVLEGNRLIVQMARQ